MKNENKKGEEQKQEKNEGVVLGFILLLVPFIIGGVLYTHNSDMEINMHILFFKNDFYEIVKLILLGCILNKVIKLKK